MDQPETANAAPSSSHCSNDFSRLWNEAMSEEQNARDSGDELSKSFHMGRRVMATDLRGCISETIFRLQRRIVSLEEAVQSRQETIESLLAVHEKTPFGLCGACKKMWSDRTKESISALEKALQVMNGESR